MVAVQCSSLSPSRRRLVSLMQRLNFGRIEGLRVVGGEPVFEPPPGVVREVKLGAAENGPRAERELADFELKSQVRALLDEIGRVDDGVVRAIDVRHGLPFSVTFEERAE